MIKIKEIKTTNKKLLSLSITFILCGFTGTLKAADSAGISGTIKTLLESTVNGDYDGDGKADLLLRHEDGTIRLYSMNGEQVLSDKFVRHPDADWKVIGANDYDGDGKSDLLIRRDSDGLVWFYGLDGSEVLKSEYVVYKNAALRLANEWKVIGASDYDGDGKADLLLRHEDGTIRLYSMNGEQVLSDKFVRHPDADWKVIGANDYDGDGKSDLLIRRDSDGLVWFYGLDGSEVLKSEYVVYKNAALRLANEWKVIGASDYDGDGKADLLLRHEDGTIRLYSMNGEQVLSDKFVRHPDADWKVIGANDYDGDGKSDLLIRRDSDGLVWFYGLDGNEVLKSEYVVYKNAALRLANEWKVLRGK